METFKEIKTTTIVNEDMTTKTTNKTLLHTIKHWNELTQEEQEEEIRERADTIYSDYQEELYQSYKDNLEELKEDFKNITFDDIYLDSNSQGGWIDRVVNFQYHCEGIEIYGECIELDEVRLTIRKYIDEDNIDIYINDYYIDDAKLERIEKTKKYQKWYNEIEKDVKAWIERANEICGNLIKEEYNYPSMLSIAWEKDWLDNYFSEEEFETIEEIKEN